MIYSYTGMMVTEFRLTSDRRSQEMFGSEIIPVLSLSFLRASLNCSGLGEECVEHKICTAFLQLSFQILSTPTDN
jgi:hypothetical protein